MRPQLCGTLGRPAARPLPCCRRRTVGSKLVTASLNSSPLERSLSALGGVRLWAPRSNAGATPSAVLYACFLCFGVQGPSSPQRRLVACRAAAQEAPSLNRELDDVLSNRWLDLDPAGYFIIKVDRCNQLIVAEHYTNTINKNGVACDPDTGKPIPCTPGYVRPASAVFSGRTAKEISVKLLEEVEKPPVTMLVHANYLGREFQRAEVALLGGHEYVQD